MLQERKVELEQRKREFVEAIDKKLSVDEIRSEFSSLKKLNDISQKLEQLMRNPVDGNQLMRTLSKIHTELNAISAIQEDNKKGGWFSNNSNTAVDRAQREKKRLIVRRKKLSERSKNYRVSKNPSRERSSRKRSSFGKDKRRAGKRSKSDGSYSASPAKGLSCI